MTETQKVIKQALTRLYQRIDLPTATDNIHYRAALAAVGSLERSQKASKAQEAPAPTETPANPLEGATVAAVQALVEQGKVSAQEALDYEEGTPFPRKTLLTWLESYSEGSDD